MFSLFKKKSPIQKLQKKYVELMAEAHRLSSIKRTQSDEKMAEANQVMIEIEQLESKN